MASEENSATKENIGVWVRDDKAGDKGKFYWRNTEDLEGKKLGIWEEKIDPQSNKTYYVNRYKEYKSWRPPNYETEKEKRTAEKDKKKAEKKAEKDKKRADKAATGSEKAAADAKAAAEEAERAAAERAAADAKAALEKAAAEEAERAAAERAAADAKAAAEKAVADAKAAAERLEKDKAATAERSEKEKILNMSMQGYEEQKALQKKGSAVPVTEIQKQDLPPGWIKFYSIEYGLPYYGNLRSGKSQWTNPNLTATLRPRQGGSSNKTKKQGYKFVKRKTTESMKKQTKKQGYKFVKRKTMESMKKQGYKSVKQKMMESMKKQTKKSRHYKRRTTRKR
jgi:hypothetical protein